MKHVYILFVSLCLISCSTLKDLQKDMQGKHGSLAYFMDSQPNSCAKSGNIYLGTINANSLNKFTTVTESDYTFLPFIIYNSSATEFEVILGQGSIHEDYQEFFRNSLIKESNRTACFNFCNLEDSANYKLEILIDTCKTKSIYEEREILIFLLYASSYSAYETCSAAETHMGISVRLKKNFETVFQKHYTFKKPSYSCLKILKTLACCDVML